MDERDRDGRTGLHHAAFADDVDRARRLLDGGADPNARDKEGFAPLHFAAQQYSVRVATLLLDRGADVDAQNRYGNTPLSTAVFNSRGRGDLIGLLRGRGADSRRKNKYGQDPVGLARLIANDDVRRFFDDLPGDEPPQPGQVMGGT